GENQGDDLGLAPKPFCKHGTYWPVNLAAGEGLALAHAAFALDKTAGDASPGVGVLAVIHGERKEIDALAGFGVGGCSGEHNVFAKAHDGRAVGLLGKFSGFDGELLSACEFDGNFGDFRLHRSSFYGAEVGQKGVRQGMESAWTGVGQGRGWETHYAQALGSGESTSGE